MKTLKELIELMNEVLLREATTNYLIKAKVSLNINPYFSKDSYEKTLISFSYSIHTAKSDDNKVNILANFSDDKEELIQHYYWMIKTQCSR